MIIVFKVFYKTKLLYTIDLMSFVAQMFTIN